MALAADEFAGGLALLACIFGLMTFDPGEFGDDEETYRFVVDVQWGRDPYPTSRRVDSEVQVFDVFTHYIDNKSFYGNLVLLGMRSDLVLLSIHAGSLLFQKSDSSRSRLVAPLRLLTGLPSP